MDVGQGINVGSGQFGKKNRSRVLKLVGLELNKKILSFFSYFLFLFMLNKEGQNKFKRYSFVVECKRFRQALQKQILHRHLGHIVHCHVELPLILLEK